MKSSIFISLLLFCLFSCSNNRTGQLVGEWSATAVTQNDNALKLDLNKIQFDFDADGTYRFTSTLDYVEEGTFSVDGDKLITTDSLQSNKSKMVLIEKLSSDTLKIKMKNQADWMLLTMAKK